MSNSNDFNQLFNQIIKKSSQYGTQNGGSYERVQNGGAFRQEKKDITGNMKIEGLLDEKTKTYTINKVESGSSITTTNIDKKTQVFDKSNIPNDFALVKFDDSKAIDKLNPTTILQIMYYLVKYGILRTALCVIKKTDTNAKDLNELNSFIAKEVKELQFDNTTTPSTNINNNVFAQIMVKDDYVICASTYIELSDSSIELAYCGTSDIQRLCNLTKALAISNPDRVLNKGHLFYLKLQAGEDIANDITGNKNVIYNSYYIDNRFVSVDIDAVKAKDKANAALYIFNKQNELIVLTDDNQIKFMKYIIVK